MCFGLHPETADAEYAKIEAQDVCIINNGIRNDWIADQTTEKRPECLGVRLVTVGGIHKRKGQLNVIRSLPVFSAIFQGRHTILRGCRLNRIACWRRSSVRS